MKFDQQTKFYNENAQKYSSYSYDHEKGDLYKKFLNKLPKQGQFWTQVVVLVGIQNSFYQMVILLLHLMRQ